MFTLTPQARAIAAFTIAVLMLTGQLRRITLGLVLLFGNAFPGGRSGQFLIALIMVAVATVVLVGTLSVSKTLSYPRSSSTGWETHLAQAAVVVAALGLGIAALAGLGAVVNGTGSIQYSVLSGGLFG